MELDPEIVEFFEEVLRRIEGHPRYSVLLRNAVAAQDQLILNYHNHAPGEPYCVSLGVYDAAIAALAIQGEFRELAHIRGIAPVEEACEPLMSVFASLLEQRFALRQRPQIYLNGAPFNAG
jgi:hypothetical protein